MSWIKEGLRTKGMMFFVHMTFRTVQDREGKGVDESEGICELYFNEETDAKAFVQAGKKSEDLESAEITDCMEDKVIYSWEK